MIRTAYIFSAASEHTTARYFVNAITLLDGWRCIYLDKLFDPAILTPNDILMYVDPAPNWPLGLESIQCITVAYLIDVHQDLKSRLQTSLLFDLVFIAQKDYLHFFNQNGQPLTSWLPLACDSEIHNQSAVTRQYEVGFVGNLGHRDTPRWKVLTAILPLFKTNDYQRYHSPLEMGNVYGQSKIVFNTSINGDVNMRVFEAMAAGALLVTDRIGNGLSELFKEDVHYVGYDSVDEAKEKISFYLSHDAERVKIAQAGQQEVLEHHTYLKRWESIMLQVATAKKSAPVRKMSRRQLGNLYAQIFVALRQPARIGVVCLRYGISFQIVRQWCTAWARWLNARVPLTPNAIRARQR